MTTAHTVQIGMTSYDPILDVTFTVVAKGPFYEADQMQTWEVATDDEWPGTTQYAEEAVYDFAPGANVGTVRREDDSTLKRVEAYLPSNYTAKELGDTVVIFGQDRAGWTWEGYVKPRLASGLIFVEDV